MVNTVPRNDTPGMVINMKKIVGLKVKQARNQLGLTQEQLAECIGRTVETVSNIERGRTNSTLDTLDEVSRCLKITLSDLLGGFDEFKGKSDRRIKLELKLREIARSLPDGDIEVAVGQIETLAKRTKR